jgi:hypothetical protein
MIADFPKKALAIISNKFPIKEKDAGEFSSFSSGQMKVSIKCFNAQGLGHVCALKASAMLGLMKMHTLVLNPDKKEMPLFSFDYITALGRQTLLLELYDTMEQPDPLLADALAPLSAVKAGMADLPDHDLGEHWYDNMKLSPSLAKRTGGKDAARLNLAAADFLKEYIALAGAAKPADGGSLKVAEYVDGLFLHGGPSTDAFKKALGESKTRTLFETVVFGTK